MIIEKVISSSPVLSFHGNKQEVIMDILSIDDDIKYNSVLSWCNDKNWNKLSNKPFGTFIVSKLTFENLKTANYSGKANFIVVENPRQYFAKCLAIYADEKVVFGIAKSAIIDPSVQLDESNVCIGHNVVIEQNVILGKGVIIEHNTVVKKNSIIGNNSKIGSNCTIGGVGFGYEKDEKGDYQIMPHVGNVVIGNNVAIGNNVCIDRAVIGSTKLSNNVKVDNLVHIAHGVTIGENSLIIANAMIAGSTVIGKNVWVAPSASIMQKKHIGDNAIIGMGSVVIKDVDVSSTVAGVPAKKLSK